MSLDVDLDLGRVTEAAFTPHADSREERQAADVVNELLIDRKIENGQLSARGREALYGATREEP